MKDPNTLLDICLNFIARNTKRYRDALIDENLPNDLKGKLRIERAQIEKYRDEQELKQRQCVIKNWNYPFP